MQRQCSFCRGRPFHRLVSTANMFEAEMTATKKVLQCLWTETRFGALRSSLQMCFELFWQFVTFMWMGMGEVDDSFPNFGNHLLLSPLLLYCQGKNFEWLWAVYVFHNLTQYHYFGLRRLLRVHYFDSHLTEGLLPCGHDGCDAAEVHLCTPRIVWVKRAKMGRETQKCRKRSEKYKTTRQFYRKVFLQGGLIAPNGYSQRHWRKLKPNPISRAPPSAVQDLLSGEITSMVQTHRIQVYLQFADHAREACSIQNLNPYNTDNTLVKRHDRRAIRNFFVLDLFTPTGWSSARFRHSGLSELRDAIRR